MIPLVICEARCVVGLLPYLASRLVLGQLETGGLSIDLQLGLQVLKLLLVLLHAHEGGRLLLLEARLVARLILLLDLHLAVVLAGVKKMKRVRGVNFGARSLRGQLLDSEGPLLGDRVTGALVRLIHFRHV